MNLFIIQEFIDISGGKVLLPLPKLIERIGFVEVSFWSLRQITFVATKHVFGIAVLDIERLSNEMKQGFLLTDADFHTFLNNDFQLIDGYIDAYIKDLSEPFFQIECIDSTQWEISTSSNKFAAELEQKGFCKYIGNQ